MAAGAATTTRVVLGDRAVLVGPIHPNDEERFLRGMNRASADSMYKRFMTPLTRLSSTQLAYLIGVDHKDHEALLAIDEESGEAIAVGRFIRSRESPIRAEAALLVIDEWHGRGLGKALCRLLAERARELGIERFEASVLADNYPMLAVLAGLGEVETVGEEGGTVQVEVPLPQIGVGEHMTGVLRAVDDDSYELVRTPDDRAG